MNTTKFKTRIAFAIVLSAVVASFTACDSVNSLLGQKKKEDNGMLLAALTLGAAPAPGTGAVTPDMTITTWTALDAKLQPLGCSTCHSVGGGQAPTYDPLNFKDHGLSGAFCTPALYASHRVMVGLTGPSGNMYRQGSTISNAAAPYVAGWIANGCNPN